MSWFPNETLDDGGAVMGHDAIVTAVRAIRLAAGQGDPVTAPIDRGQVIQMLGQLHGVNALPGASGWISLDNDGNPEHKAMPIVELQANGSVSFVELGSSEGAPFHPNPAVGDCRDEG